jgi:hypothetical protein
MKCKEARKAIRFIFSEQGLADNKKSEETFKEFYNFHLLDKRKNRNKDIRKSCERCFKYYFRIQSKFSKREGEK